MQETSDQGLLELLRISGAKSVPELVQAMEVTATAVRQRLTRLMAQGLIERSAVRAERGRPSHRYSLTEKARRRAGSNFGDLAVVLWNEIRTIQDPQIRRGLLERVASAMADAYRGKVNGETLADRMEALESLFGERGVPFKVGTQDGLPVLTALDCPYPTLAEQDRGICAVEKLLFSKLLDEPVRLSQCRLDGHACCQFQTN